MGSTTLALRICHDADPSVQEVFRNISAGLHSCRHCPGFCGRLAVSMSRFTSVTPCKSSRTRCDADHCQGAMLISQNVDGPLPGAAKPAQPDLRV